MERMVQDKLQLEKGEIKIGCSSTLTKLVLLDAIKNFHDDYPGVNVTIVNYLNSDLIKHIYTTDSILTKEHAKITIVE